MTMRYRKLSSTGDYVFGAGMGEFWVDTPEAVAQAVLTRLLLSQGEWYLDINEGTPYATQILGTGTQDLYDAAVQERILGTPNVLSILTYSSRLDEKRNLSIACTIETAFGNIALKIPGSTLGGAGFFTLDVSTLDSPDILA